MDTNKKDSDNSPASNSISSNTAVVQATQPLPKKENEIRANVEAKSKKSDSNPTL